MGNISSINFKDFNEKKALHQIKHNDRTIPPSYLIGSGDFHCDRSANEAETLMREMIEDAKMKYKIHVKQKFKSTRYLCSAVVNIKESTTMADLNKLKQYFMDNYGFQCYQKAIHKDEGYKDDDGVVRYNYHAHLEFVTLDKNTGKNNRRKLSRSVLQKIQTDVARILGQERGVRGSKTKRLEPRKPGGWAQLKEAERKERKKQQKLAFEMREKELKEFWQFLMEQSKNNEILDGILSNFKELNFKVLREIFEQIRKKFDLYKSARNTAFNIAEMVGYDTSSGLSYKKLKSCVKNKIDDLNNEISNLKFKKSTLSEEKSSLESENSKLKNQIKSLKNELNKKDDKIVEPEDLQEKPDEVDYNDNSNEQPTDSFKPYTRPVKKYSNSMKM